jgi:uncharacterized RDD family membrane protein YckC
MRCPKCSYLSYDDVERCRNCGYDFALATSAREVEPPVTTEPEPEDLRTWSPSTRRRGGALDTAPPTEGAALDLPLFEEPTRPELPPVVIPPAGPPLSVRRKLEPRPAPRLPATPDLLGATDAPTTPGPGFDWTDDAPTEPEGRAQVRDESFEPPREASDALGARLRAGLVDAAILIAIDLLTVWLTFRVAGLTWEEWRLLPLVPVIGFLFLLDTAYLVTFTAASGQTIGKMLAGVRVVYGAHGRVPFGHAVLRSVVVLLCVLPAGLGLVPLFLDASRRGAHDRLAGTRVVPVS